MPLTLADKLWRLQNDPAWTTILLPVDERHPDVKEEVLVERITSNRLRIASSPGMIEGLATDDVIELASDAPSGYRLVERGKNLCIHLYTKAEERGRIQALLVEKLGWLGGWLDGTMGVKGLCFTVPVRAGFPAVEAVMREVGGEEWYFSNVYDPKTDEPLLWWKE